MMKRLFTPCFLLAFCILLFVFQANAQNFLWARSGGSSENGNGVETETVRNMATDRNGNVYILTHVKKLGMNIGGQPLSGYGWTDVILASFKPDGTQRWVKLVGTGSADEAHWMGTDAQDGVYFSASINKYSSIAYIDTDATSPKNYQRNILVKYDTGGNFQWYRHPEADTLSTTASWSTTGTVAMDIGKSGTVYWLMQLYPGSYGGGGLTVPNTGIYLLKYSAGGNFSYVKPDIIMSGALATNLTVDEVNNRFYFSGSGWNGLVMGGDTVKSMYIGSFKLDGSFLWKRTSSIYGGSFGSRTAIDGAGNIYLAGSATAQTTSHPATVFNGHTVMYGKLGTPFVTKMDKNGNHLWSREADAKNAGSWASAVALRGKELIITGTYNGVMEWPGYSYANFSTSTNYDVFITRFDTSNGYVLGMDRIASSPGYNEYPRRMIGDGKGNIYIGGEFTERMYVTQHDTLVSTGGDTDWFLVKYGDMWPVSVNSMVAGEVKIYPNPASDYLYLEGAEAGMKLTILNMLGQEVYRGLLQNSSEVINISVLAPGNYILQLTGTDGSKNMGKLQKM